MQKAGLEFLSCLLEVSCPPIGGHSPLFFFLLFCYNLYI
uniref:Uncharacterized protein n=1 Tax=Myoviridae sp. ctJ2i1 TaxID=2825079 RepID=A0A8S5V1P1_9CAUD|nr:MAG TPA: hypothetical protein [Myoviridae sp. ctJ2i1]